MIVHVTVMLMSLSMIYYSIKYNLNEYLCDHWAIVGTGVIALSEDIAYLLLMSYIVSRQTNAIAKHIH